MREVMRTVVALALAATLAALPSAAGPVRAERGQESGRALGLAPGAEIGRLPASAKRFALVVGIDDYSDSQITTLRGGARDAAALSAALVRHAGFPEDQVVVLASDQPAERQPTRGNILRRLSNLKAVIPEDGLLLVSFSGHGIERDGRAFLLPSDAQVSSDVDLLEQTAVDVEAMRRSIKATGVGQVIVLLDACRNDPVGGRADSANPLSAAYTRGFDFDVANREVQAFATIYATGVGHRAYEYTERNQGYFTWAVVEGLSGAAAGADGRVTLAGLVRYVQEAVPKRIGLDLGAGKQQKPFARIEGYRADELVVAVGGPAPPAASMPPGPDPRSVEQSYWKAIESSRDATVFEDYLKEYPNGAYASVARIKARTLRESAAPGGAKEPSGGGAPAGGRAGDTVEDLGGGVRIEMVFVPAGSFEMGSKKGKADERPVDRVTITRGFQLGKYEVTQLQWKAVMGSSPSKFAGKDDLPVEQVSWEDAQELLRRLNAKTGGGWRLPTEAEWEYACRAGTSGDYAGALGQAGWYRDNSGGSTNSVGQKQPNGWGFYDMHGNVWEWCQDLYDASYYSRRPGSDPAGPGSGSLRVLRGGGWNHAAAHCRSAARGANIPGFRFGDLGLRLARTVR